MLPFTQRNRLAAIISPLGEDALGLISFQGRESISQPFEYVAQVISRDANLDFDKLVGAPVMLRLETMRGGRRFFSGIVNRLEQVASQKHYARYQLTIVPWLWFLTRCSDCHIYQDKTVPQILEEVLKRYQLGDYELRLTGKYHPKEYCVQYRETDFNFVNRLMEQEGIYYYHVHTKSKHILVIADSPGAHESRKGYEELLYRPGDSSRRDLEQILGWTIRREAQSGAFEHRDYDFKSPSKDLSAHSLVRRKHDLSQGEVFDFPGGFVAHDEGRQYAKVRLQEMQVRHAVVQGEADARGLATGFVFKLKEHPRKDQCGKHLVIDTQISVRVGEYESEEASERDDSPFFHCSFRVVDAEEQLRPERRTPKPVVQGPQTAIVVGPPGAEIHVDEHARVRVHFHWDRHHEATAEDSSCWMRVSQPWAGKGYGGMNIPRVGQEVVVEFLEGDPDRPLINGRLYNGESMPHASNAGRDGKEGNTKPTGIPEAAMMTSFKSNSFGGSGGHNEITMNDAAGKEGLFLKAQKDEIHKVGNDREDTVGNNETISIGNNRDDTVGNNETRKVGNDRSREVANNETIKVANNQDISIGVNRTETVGAEESVTVGANRNLTVAANNTETVGSTDTKSVGANQMLTVGANQSVTVGANLASNIGASANESIGMMRQLNVGLIDNVTAGLIHNLNAGLTVTISAGVTLTLKGPGGTIEIGPSGITIDGKTVTIKGNPININP
ncbi:MAG: type VI secretion system tip protein VgrG [Verrucomicrobiales bacterium]|nr:type VI secretion system tip protein VgrG [Verrucomicrobiales bacterium]